VNLLSAVYHAFNKGLANDYIEMLHAGERLGYEELLKPFNLYMSGSNF
tara:strand:- start:122 stop:265 length:144 start_codon:yes stop_codon:yes gene_type:complete